MLREATRRLRIAFALAERAEQLDAKELDGAMQDIGRFLYSAKNGPGAETGGIWVGSRLPNVTAREVAELRLTVRSILDAVVHGVSVATPPLPELTITLGPVVAGRQVVVRADGSVPDRFVLALMLLLAHVGAERVRACPACGGAFLKLGRRAHCHRPECRRHRASEYWQRYMKTPKGRRALRKHYQRMYETVYAENGWTPGARSRKPRRSGGAVALRRPRRKRRPARVKG
jgi:hypothetical protein